MNTGEIQMDSPIKIAPCGLDENRIPYEALDIEKQPQDVVDKVIEVNGGEDWVVPTMEYKGKWRPGQIFNVQKLHADLTAWGII